MTGKLCTKLVATAAVCVIPLLCAAAGAEEWYKPYSPHCTERENVFAFTEKPSVKLVGNSGDTHPISSAPGIPGDSGDGYRNST